MRFDTPYFDCSGPIPPFCARVRDLGSVAFRLKRVVDEAFAKLLTPQWLNGPFADSDYRYPVEYVPGFDQVQGDDKCVNLAEIADGLVILLEAYSPRWKGAPRDAEALTKRLLAEANDIAEWLGSLRV